MQTDELFKLITRVPKWYGGFTTAQNAYNIKKRFQKNTLGIEVLTRLFNHYGYELKSSWEKK